MSRLSSSTSTSTSTPASTSSATSASPPTLPSQSARSGDRGRRQRPRARARPVLTAMVVVALGAVSGLATGTMVEPVYADTPPLSVYGFARMDIIFDDSRLSDVQSPLVALPEGADGNDAELSLHPRLTRFGLTVDDWRINGALRGEAALEVDFQDFPNQAAESAPLPRLRQAYVQVSLERLQLLAGQTSDLIAPLFPAANNDTLMWNAGNVGDRRPQLRLSFMPNDHVRVAIAAAAGGTIDGQDADGDGLADGVDGAMPMMQHLVELRTLGAGNQIARFGVWGHVARQEIAGVGVASFSLGAHLVLPLTRRLSLLGEGFGGCNLADIRGGIGHGVNPVTAEPVCAGGGWGELAYVASDEDMVAAGATVDRAVADTLADGDPARNQTAYAVWRHRPHANLQLGLEYVYWLTRYVGGGRGAANRVNAHITMVF